MSINRLIAMGGSNVPSPVSRFQEGMQRGQQVQANNLAMQANRQNMDVQRQEMQMKKSAAFQEKLMPALKWLDKQENKEVAYQQYVLPFATELAQQHGVDPNKIDRNYNQQKMDIVKQAWEKETGTRKDFLYQGQRVPGIVSTEGQAVHADTGKPMPGATYAPTRATQGEPGAYTSDFKGKGAEDKEQAYAMTMRENVYQLQGAVNGIIEQIESSPEYVGGVSGTLVKGLNSLSQQYDQLRGKPDDLIGEDGTFNKDRTGKLSKENLSWLRKAAIDTGTVDSAVLELAFAHAKYLNNSGKISDADIRAAREIIEETDRGIQVQKLRNLKKRSLDNYNNIRKARKGMKSSKFWTDIEVEDPKPPLPPAVDDDTFIDSLMGF